MITVLRRYLYSAGAAPSYSIDEICFVGQDLPHPMEDLRHGGAEPTRFFAAENWKIPARWQVFSATGGARPLATLGAKPNCLLQ
jgi:hypothetical protein